MGQVSLIDGHIDGAEICVSCGRDIPEGYQYCIICGTKKRVPKRQIDRIREMSVEELAKLLHKIGSCSYAFCKDCPLCGAECMSEIGIKEWLESEVAAE